jgi:hypothetical protein
VARNLYSSLGFEQVGGITDLRVARTPHIDTSGPMPRLRTFAAGEWQPLYELANHQLGAQKQWWRALRRSEFQQGFEAQFAEWTRRAIGQERVYRRAIQDSPRFEAAAILSAQRWRGEHRLQLWTRPEHYGDYDSALIRWSLATLQDYPRWPINVSLAADHTPAIELVEFYGFRPLRTLLTLRKRVDGRVDGRIDGRVDGLPAPGAPDE